MDEVPSPDPVNPGMQPLSSPSNSPLPDSELQAYIETYPFAAEPTYFTRPNRYYGPASTWRSWTAGDRAVAEDVLYASRAADLGVHLFNAFALKQMAASANGGQLRSRSRSRSRARSAETDGPEPLFAPPEIWTAWPLRARDVPRNTHSAGPQEHSSSSFNTSRPSAALEDALIATSLRHAKEQWNQREREPELPQVDRRKRDWKAEMDLTKQQLRHSGLLEDDDDDDKPDGQGNDGQDYTVDTNTDIEDREPSPSPELNLPPSIATFSSQAFAAAVESSSEGETETSKSEDDIPLFSADDHEARRILLPSTRHILAKLDDLLVGLHKARLAYAVRDPESRSRSTSRPESTDDERFVRSGSRAASRKRGRKRKRSISSQEDDSSQKISASRSRVRSATRQYGTKGKGFGVRDWSDVLGMAALTGWNTETIARASERCAKLFGQNMMFRTFHESGGDAAGQNEEEPYFEEEFAYVPTASEPLLSVSTDVTPAGTQRLDNDEGIMYIRDQSSPYNSRTCPYQDCPRHISGKPFAKRYHLERHLSSVHGQQSPQPPDSPTKVASTFLLPVRGKTGGDETLSCPVLDCHQEIHTYTRSTRLYDHIRHAHPHFDLEEYKKIAGKGRRGKYDRSRSRGVRRKNVQEQGHKGTSSDDEDATFAPQRNHMHRNSDSSDAEYVG